MYLLLPQVARIEQAFRVAFSLKMPIVAFSLGAQILSYIGSGYLLRAVVGLVQKPVSVVEGALLTAGANSVGTLGGDVPGTVVMTYLWLRRRGASPGAAGLGAWIPIVLNDATLTIVSLLGLLTLILLRKFSSVLVLGFALAVLILAGGMGALLWSLSHRERLMPLAMSIANCAAKLQRKTIDRNATRAFVGRLLEAWDRLLEGGWRRSAAGGVKYWL